MSLDDIISNRRTSTDARRSHNFRPKPRHRSSASSHGPIRHSFWREPVRPYPNPMREPTIAPEPVMLHSGRDDRESGTKLYISNLDYGVSNGDIKLLFSEVGELQRYSVHYDRSGRSKGTAEVVFARQQDALTSIERYNNVQLDGKPMKIELVGADVLITAPVNTGRPYGFPRSGQGSYVPRGQGSYVPRRQGSYVPRGEESYAPRGGGRGGFRDRGSTKGQGQVRRHGEKVTAEELDTELEKYHLAGKKIN